MAKTRINTLDDKHHSDTMIQSQLLQKKRSSNFTIEEDSSEAMVNMIAYRAAEINQIAEDAQHIKEMMQYFAGKVDEQQPVIETVVKTLESANNHTKKIEQNLLEAETGRKCSIL